MKYLKALAAVTALLLLCPLAVAQVPNGLGLIYSNGGGPQGTITNGTSGQCLQANGVNAQPSYGACGASTGHYDVGFVFVGVPANSQVFAYFVPDRPLTIPSGATNSTCTAKVAATGSTTITLKKNGSSVATAVWSASGTTCSFTMSSSASWNGTTDTLEIDGPASADATLATIGVVFAGTTTSP